MPTIPIAANATATSERGDGRDRATGRGQATLRTQTADEPGDAPGRLLGPESGRRQRRARRREAAGQIAAVVAEQALQPRRRDLRASAGARPPRPTARRARRSPGAATAGARAHRGTARGAARASAAETGAGSSIRSVRPEQPDPDDEDRPNHAHRRPRSPRRRPASQRAPAAPRAVGRWPPSAGSRRRGDRAAGEHDQPGERVVGLRPLRAARDEQQDEPRCRGRDPGGDERPGLTGRRSPCGPRGPPAGIRPSVRSTWPSSRPPTRCAITSVATTRSAVGSAERDPEPLERAHEVARHPVVGDDRPERRAQRHRSSLGHQRDGGRQRVAGPHRARRAARSLPASTAAGPGASSDGATGSTRPVRTRPATNADQARRPSTRSTHDDDRRSRKPAADARADELRRETGRRARRRASQVSSRSPVRRTSPRRAARVAARCTRRTRGTHRGRGGAPGRRSPQHRHQVDPPLA